MNIPFMIFLGIPLRGIFIRYVHTYQCLELLDRRVALNGLLIYGARCSTSGVWGIGIYEVDTASTLATDDLAWRRRVALV